MCRSFILYVQDTVWWCSRKLVQIEITWVWLTQNRIRIVWHGIHQKISRLDYHKLKTMVKRSVDRKLRLRNFDDRNNRIETGAMVTSHRGLSGVGRLGIAGCLNERAGGKRVCSGFRIERRPMQYPARRPWACKNDTENRSILWATNTER